MSVPTTHRLDVPGALLTYDIRQAVDAVEPVLLLIGSPMTADGFTALAERFPDRTVVTYDPRGAGRSPRIDGATETTPAEHADDLHRLISVLGSGPVDVFASSGGAVNALALISAHPDDVRLLVDHEPPLWQLVPDREAGLAAAVDIHETYLRDGRGPAMAKFIALVSHEGEIPADFASRPAPEPTMFGLPAEDDGSRDDPLVGQNMISCSFFQPDLDALRGVASRIVVGVGADSGKVVTGRAAIALAGLLGMEPVTFPGGHAGFLPVEWGQGGDPDAFAVTLRHVLTGRPVAVGAGR
ncbi:MAG TPA: alpha/beta hydrolase [Candidatus Dormibacteraeota bacterium]|nr:alpha/beta hydrolase [Candidatus Dormibacteraeota bacterium]